MAVVTSSMSNSLASLSIILLSIFEEISSTSLFTSNHLTSEGFDKTIFENLPVRGRISNITVFF